MYNILTQEQFNTLQNKYGLEDKQIDNILSEIEETGTYKGPLGYNQTMGKTTNLFQDLFNLNVFNQKQLSAKKKADLIFEQQREEKRESEAREAQPSKGSGASKASGKPSKAL